MNVTGSDVSRVGIAIGVLLVVLGVAAYVLSDFASITALLPAVFGVVCVFLGRLGLETDRDRQVGIGLGILAAVGMAGSIQGLGAGVSLLMGEAVENPIAAGSQSIMAILSFALLVAVVLYFYGER